MRKVPASFEQNIEFWWAFPKIQGFLGTFPTQSVTRVKVENEHKSGGGGGEIQGFLGTFPTQSVTRVKVENEHKSWTKQPRGYIFVER